MKKIFAILLVVMMLVAFSACGTEGNNETNTKPAQKEDTGSFDTNTKADESLFEWEGNLIAALTAEGAERESILIPARCEGFYGSVFVGTSVKHVAFEDDDDVMLDVAFMSAEQLVSVKLPANLTVISSMVFKGCESLKTITLPASVNTLEAYAFKDCTSLETVVFEGNALTVIGGNSFENCESLTTITIPDGVTTIEQYAFADCAALATLNLSETVKEIAKFAFADTALKELHLPAGMQLEYLDMNAFGTDATKIVVYIVKDSWCDKNQSVWNFGLSEVKYE